jgi:Rps23 Pro-64 3,4-dihydroxylase Tpa1-like proline 4-hydroxylase
MTQAVSSPIVQPYLWWRDFLPSEMVQQVRQVALDNQHKFVPTTVSTNVADYRKSTVLWHYNFMPLYETFTRRLREFLPIVQMELNRRFVVGNIEVQMTSSSNQEYFKAHTDNGTPDTDHRKLSYVYYFLLNEPRQFTGGELTLTINPVATIQPNHNSIVFFPSEYWHEVHPVSSSGLFMDSRLTINGWVRDIG